MADLMLALYAEGSTDERFLPIIIRRTAEQIIYRRGRGSLVVQDVVAINLADIPGRRGRAERILAAAHRAAGFHLLCVHADADRQTLAQALGTQFEPGRTRVEGAVRAREPVCERLVPVIPVRMTEAWMLADGAALQAELRTTLSATALGIPAHARQIERDPAPKQTIIEAIQRAYASRRRQPTLGALYGPLAERINLDELHRLPAYQHFVHDLTQTLIDLQFAQ